MTSELTVNVFLHKMLGPSYERRGRTTVRTLADMDVATGQVHSIALASEQCDAKIIVPLVKGLESTPRFDPRRRQNT